MSTIERTSPGALAAPTTSSSVEPVAEAAGQSSRRRAGRLRRLLLTDPTGLLGAVLLLAVAVVCVAAPLLTPADPVRVNLVGQLQGPSAVHPLGTDNLGRDILARILYGGRASLAVAAGVTLLSLTISVTLGGIAGYAGGKLDELLMRLADLTLAFPRLVLAIAIAGLLGAGLVSLVVASIAVSWASFARMVRGMVLQVREEEYVLVAHALGASPWRVLGRHLLPAIAGPVAVLASLDFGRIILNVSALSFLGLGIQPPAPEWGSMLNDGRLFFARSPELMLYPGLAIFLTVLAANLLGDALRDALDPRRR